MKHLVLTALLVALALSCQNVYADNYKSGNGLRDIVTLPLDDLIPIQAPELQGGLCLIRPSIEGLSQGEPWRGLPDPVNQLLLRPDVIGDVLRTVFGLGTQFLAGKEFAQRGIRVEQEHEFFGIGVEHFLANKKNGPALTRSYALA